MNLSLRMACICLDMAWLKGEKFNCVLYVDSDFYATAFSVPAGQVERRVVFGKFLIAGLLLVV